MSTLVGYFTTVLAWVLAQLQVVITAVVAEPLLLLFVIIGFAGLIFGFAKSFLHF
jgi:hypothetical protein